MKYVFLFLSCCVTGLSQHTFSIVAIDALTGEVGSAGATCLSGDPDTKGARIISGLAPGFGAINAQATVCIPNVNASNGQQNLLFGLGAQQVLESLLAGDACFYGTKLNRQYGIVSIDSAKNIKSAGYTGDSCRAFAGHLTGANYSIQGNILIGRKVIDSMEAHFLRAKGSLATRLMFALQGAKMIGADSRCKADGTSSRSAFIRVAKPTDPIDEPSLDLAVFQLDFGTEPIDELQKQFDAVVEVNDQTFSLSAVLVSSIVSDEIRVRLRYNTRHSAFIIYNLISREVLKGNVGDANLLQIDIRFLTAGAYVLCLLAEDGTSEVAHFCVWR